MLRDLYLQTSCEEQYAFRLYFARPEVSEKLTTPGTRIADFGVQSASIHLPHAENWQLEHPTEATEKFIFVLDKNVPKQNISTGFLPDLVAVMPGEVLEVSDVAELPGTTYIMLKAVQMQSDQPVYSPFDGTAYVNLSAKKDYLTSFQTPK
ncbi:hypothetical protein J2739_000369 [Variovorax soli]|uniref:Uncharacterized protein n=1 Tax=Variovorax soli TaxID=376815 RepID=A0ABU1N837_9BURK|nr:hypothetical protein [Variovorax soli]